MNQQELYKRHKEIKCKNCTLKDQNCTLNCEIHITISNTTKCKEGELNESNNNTIYQY